MYLFGEEGKATSIVKIRDASHELTETEIKGHTS